MTIKRMTFLQDLLDFVGLGGRLHVAWISSAEAQRFVQVVTAFTEKIRALGPSPLAAAGALPGSPVRSFPEGPFSLPAEAPARREAPSSALGGVT